MYESSSQEAVCKDHKPPLGMTQAEVEEDGDQRQPPGFHMVRLPWAEDAVWPVKGLGVQASSLTLNLTRVGLFVTALSIPEPKPPKAFRLLSFCFVVSCNP